MEVQYLQTNDTYRISDLKLENLKILNIVDYGGAGNGQIDNSAAFNSLISDLTDNSCIFIPNGNFLIQSEIIFENFKNLLFICVGNIYIPNTLKRGIHFKSCTNVYGNLNIYGYNFNQNDFTYSLLPTNQNQNKNAIYFELCNMISLDIYAENYYGVVLEGNSSWQYNMGNIKIKNSGQTYYIGDSDRTGIGNLGNIYAEELAGSFFKGGDIYIPYYENYIPNNSQAHGVVFTGCNSLRVGVISIGYSSLDYLISLMSSQNVCFTDMYCYGGMKDTEGQGKGLLIKESYNCNINGSIVGCRDDALTINGCYTSIINILCLYNNNECVVDNTSLLGVFDIDLTIKSRYRYGRGITVNKTNEQGIENISISIETLLGSSGYDACDIYVNSQDAKIKLNGYINQISLPTPNLVDGINAIIGSYKAQKPLANAVPFTIYEGWTQSTQIDSYVQKTNNVINGVVGINGTGGTLTTGEAFMELDPIALPSRNVWLYAIVLGNVDGSSGYHVVPCCIDTFNSKCQVYTLIDVTNVSRIQVVFNHTIL